MFVSPFLDASMENVPGRSNATAIQGGVVFTAIKVFNKPSLYLNSCCTSSALVQYTVAYMKYTLTRLSYRKCMFFRFELLHSPLAVSKWSDMHQHRAR